MATGGAGGGPPLHQPALSRIVGEIEVAGKPLADKDESALALLRRERIGIVFQFFNLLGA